jgi:hypothetical protein
MMTIKMKGFADVKFPENEETREKNMAELAK